MPHLTREKLKKNCCFFLFQFGVNLLGIIDHAKTTLQGILKIDFPRSLFSSFEKQNKQFLLI